MEPALTLREAFAGLAGHDGAANVAGPDALGAHEGLPEDLLIRAIGSYADTAPAEVAEHLSAFVAAPTGAEEGLHLLAVVPETSEGEVSLAGIEEPPGADDPAEDHGDLGDLGDLGHLGALDNADSLDALDHAPIAQPQAAHSAPDVTHDADFGQSAAEAHEPAPENDIDQSDAEHVSLEDLSHDAVAEHDPGFEGDAHEDAAVEPAPEHHDDGHHDPGLDHFAG